MAATSTINAWIEELASSLLPSTPVTTKQRPRRAIEGFRKQVRQHNYARTNQFDVEDRLDGLEEKFQVLNREDLSDAIYNRRVELRQHEERWIPDVLDLLLRISSNPLQQDDSIGLSDTTAIIKSPAILKWSDIGEDSTDKGDPIWKIPTFSDPSSEEDEDETATSTASPASPKLRRSIDFKAQDEYAAPIFQTLDAQSVHDDLKSLHVTDTTEPRKATELRFIRQILFLFQGYPSDILKLRDGKIWLDDRFQLRNISINVTHALLQQIQPRLSDYLLIKDWIDQERSSIWIESAKQPINYILQEHNSFVCTMEEQVLHPRSIHAFSLLEAVTQIDTSCAPLSICAAWVRQIKDTDSVTVLDTLYAKVREADLMDNTTTKNVLLPVFIEAFAAYMRPIDVWVGQGSISSTLEPMFIRRINPTSSASDVWHGSYDLDLIGPHRPPSFLQASAQNILSCGKTVAFINYIEFRETTTDKSIDKPSLIDRIQDLTANPLVPFSAGFVDTLESHFAFRLTSNTSILRKLLESRCAMTQTLDAFEHLYLRRQGSSLDTFESRIFSRIDKCIDSWNDRFLIADMLEDSYAKVDCIDFDSIIIRSAHTSSRSMESRRRSVRILSALSIEYSIPWPIANIIPQQSLTAYRHIALHLTQIRRAKYTLERTAYTHVNSTPISPNPQDQRLAQTTTFMLLQFTNTLYDHFTTGTTSPLTTKMRVDLQTANTVDAMIAVHKLYISTLEFVCLTSKPLKMLRDTLVGLLDMCIRFADLVSTPANVAAGRHRGSVDLETGSFVSAHSRRRKGTRDDASSDDADGDDDEDLGDGYSSFIVLEEDTSVAQEVKKLLTQFRRQLDFFVAGLRGVARGGGTVDEFEVLADRLEWRGRS